MLKKGDYWRVGDLIAAAKHKQKALQKANNLKKFLNTVGEEKAAGLVQDAQIALENSLHDLNNTKVLIN